MSSIRVGGKREVWIGVQGEILVLVRGIRSEVYLREGDIYVIQAPFAIQAHQKKKNPKDKLLLADLRDSSSPKFVNSQWNDYNKCTNAPFVY